MLGAGTLEWNRDGVVLTKEQKQFYEKNGYIVIRNVVPQYELDRFYSRFKVFHTHIHKNGFRTFARKKPAVLK